MSIILSEGETRELNVTLTPIPPELATLIGTITDANTGLAVIGATITITGLTTYSATSDSSGYYQITDIIPGTYDGTVTHADYEKGYF